MPTVLRVDGFAVMIFLPDREHGPAHVHVFRGEGEVVIFLNEDGEAVTIRDSQRMSPRDAWRALQIVEDHATELRHQWRKYHG